MYPTAIIFMAPVSRFNLKSPDFLLELSLFFCFPRKASTSEPATRAPAPAPVFGGNPVKRCFILFDVFSMYTFM